MATICLQNEQVKCDEPRAQAKHSNYHPKKSWIHTRKFSDRNVHFSKWFSATSEAKPQGYAQTSDARHNHVTHSPLGWRRAEARWRVTVGDIISKALEW